MDKAYLMMKWWKEDANKLITFKFIFHPAFIVLLLALSFEWYQFITIICLHLSFAFYIMSPFILSMDEYDE